MPYHVLFNKLPDYNFVKTFGCSCFPLLRPYNNHILDYRSHECLFLGYSTSHKGYKCLSPSGKIFNSKDVLFNESKYPNVALFESTASSSKSSSTSFQFPSIPIIVPNLNSPISSSQPSSSTQPTQSEHSEPANVPLQSVPSAISVNQKLLMFLFSLLILNKQLHQ